MNALAEPLNPTYEFLEMVIRWCWVSLMLWKMDAPFELLNPTYLELLKPVR